MDSKWFLFRVHSIDDEGLEMHLDPLKGTPAMDATGDLRPLGPGLYDLPGPSSCLWEGYVLASSEKEAEDRVIAAH